jgi:hypothetical protein
MLKVTNFIIKITITSFNIRKYMLIYQNFPKSVIKTESIKIK